MPALSPTMTEGNLARWLKKEGDQVKAGDVIAEIETDKATMEVEAVDEGTLARIVVPEGTEGVKVNAVIAVLAEEGEAVDAAAAPKPDAPKAAAPAPQPAPAPPPSPKPPSAQPAAAPAPSGNGHDRGERQFVSPLARRMAEQAGIDLAGIAGSGPHGRIVKADIEASAARPKSAEPERAKPAPSPTAAPATTAPAATAPAAPAAPTGTALPGALGKAQVAALAGNIPYTEVPHTAMRKVIARRLTESKQTVPHYYLTVDCDIDALLKVRAELNARAAGFKLSVNDFVIRAAALALRKMPEVNASWSEEAVLQWNSIDISVAVAIESGLITPIVKKADQKGLATISNEMKDMAERAKSGKLKLEEFQGGTFSISNLGMFGIRHFEAVINPPQSCILAVGAGEQRPVVKNGALAIATIMSCTLSVDHRVVDGAVGAQFLSEIKKLIEDPLAMLL
jgi:pyruvate dehydrogenase E2 component (dihydrolipoamide acetyltransferase)